MSFSLIDEPWIPVLDLAGRSREVSLKEVFAGADQFRMIACELPTQTFAILRLLLAILHRVTEGPQGEQAWRALWKRPKLPADIDGYLDEYRDRFDLLHPTQPFYQVANLRTAKGETFGLERIVADVPNGIPYLTSRAGSGMDMVTPAEAAIWVVHCQAFDTSGIKSGADGDSARVKGGKVYPLGVAPAGWLSGVYVEGTTLRETLLLNLVPLGAQLRSADERDAPIWEREHLGVVEEETERRGPFGVLSLYTWQSRRLRLYGNRDGITGAMVSYGDTLEWQDLHLLEPMSIWSRSATREKKQSKAAVYLPRPHDHTRALWRGLTSLLPQPTSGSNEAPQRLAPIVMQWLARLSRTGVVDDDLIVSPRAVSAIYGSQQSIIDQIFGDSVTMSVHLAREDSDLRTCVIDAVDDADAVVKALRSLAHELAIASGASGDGIGAGDRAAEVAYALLDRRFRGWLARLAPGSDPIEQRAGWQRAIRHTAVQLGHDLIAAAGPHDWVANAQAAARFWARLRKALSMADDGPTVLKEEVSI